MLSNETSTQDASVQLHPAQLDSQQEACVQEPNCSGGTWPEEGLADAHVSGEAPDEIASSGDKQGSTANPVLVGVHGRLQEIVKCLDDEELDLDEALALLEEAAALSLKVTELLDEQLNEKSGE